MGKSGVRGPDGEPGIKVPMCLGFLLDLFATTFQPTADRFCNSSGLLKWLRTCKVCIHTNILDNTSHILCLHLYREDLEYPAYMDLKV